MSFRYVAAGLLLFTAAPAELRAQSYFETRLKVIKEQVAALPAATSSTVVLLGDSITEGFFKHDVLPKELDGHLVIDQGIGGDDIGTSVSKTGVVSRLDQVKQAKPSVVFLMIGVNNLWDVKKSPEAIIGLYEEMLPQLQAAVPDARIVLQTILPTRDNMAFVNDAVTTVNERIRKLAKEKSLTLLDLHTMMEDDKGELKAEYSADGVHLTKAAYELWFQKLQDVVRSGGGQKGLGEK